MRFIGNAPVDGEVRAIASGALATGEAVIVNSDGTVSVVGPVAVSQAVGSPTVFEAAAATHISSVYDTASQKVVIAYVDETNSAYGTAVVGTVSGTSISFGTPVVFSSTEVIGTSAVYDSNAQKVLIAYVDGGNSYYGTAIVGTVSGTSISFGSATVFRSAWASSLAFAYDTNAQKPVVFYRDNGNNQYGSANVGTVSGTSISFGSTVVFNSAGTDELSATYDTNAQKTVVAYKDEGNSNYGTAIVGTVSGTSISFGTESVFESASTSYSSAVYEASAQKVVIAYRDGGNSGYGTAIVGTVSGTSISFGSAVIFNAGVIDGIIGSAYNSSDGKIVFSYRDGGNSQYGTFIVGTVSGTSISFGSETVFELADTRRLSSTYDSGTNRVVIAYQDNGNSQYGTCIVVRNAGSEPNLTSENFVGFANSGYADGQSAALNSTCSVDKNQSGLTAGETYYVQVDGTLGTTPADPSVLAGTAISSNSIIVKG
jgi:hypothetical protein